MRQFAYLLRPAFDRAFMAAAGERERAVVDEHWEFLHELHRRGRLVLAGRCYDGPFGIVVLEAEDEAEAESVMRNDPSVAAGVQRAKIYPFKVGLLKGEAA
ncbi:MAG TPA: YciI family protein [Gaiellaceae bacterium]|nr:YciI family protein [Gaiellaceae bacterium]